MAGLLGFHWHPAISRRLCSGNSDVMSNRGPRRWFWRVSLAFFRRRSRSNERLLAVVRWLAVLAVCCLIVLVGTQGDFRDATKLRFSCCIGLGALLRVLGEETKVPTTTLNSATVAYVIVVLALVMVTV